MLLSNVIDCIKDKEGAAAHDTAAPHLLGIVPKKWSSLTLGNIAEGYVHFFETDFD